MAEDYVYFLASRPGGAIYVGVTNDLVRRIYEHKCGAVQGHTKRYRIAQLVHFESYSDIRNALQREKNIKKWPAPGRRGLSSSTIRLGVISMKTSLGPKRCLPKRDRRDKPGDDSL